MTTPYGTNEAGIQAEDMGRSCAYCKGRTFRRSRLKFKDVGSLLALHYPVRCLSCSKRQSVGFETARRAVPSTVRQVKARKEAAPWDGSPWSRPRSATAPGEPTFLGGGAVDAVSSVPSAREPMAMPDLHGITLPHVVTPPPGNGENLA